MGLCRYAAKPSLLGARLAPAERGEEHQRQRRARRVLPDRLRQRHAVHLRHVHVQDADVEGLVRPGSTPSASAGDPVARGRMPQASRCAVRMRRLVALSSTTSTRLPRSGGCTPLRSRRVGTGRLGGGRPDREAELAAVAHLARDPDPAAHQLGQALADRQPQAGAAVAARGRGVDLAERLEQPVQPVRRDADAGVADREGQLVKRRRAVEAAGAHREDDLAPLGELDGVGEQVEQDLAQPRHVADDGGGGPVADARRPGRAPSRRPGRPPGPAPPRRTRGGRRAGTPAPASPPRSSRSRGCR